MALFFTCPICRLHLPSSVVVTIVVNNRGKLQRVTICENCKRIKEAQSNKFNQPQEGV